MDEAGGRLFSGSWDGTVRAWGLGVGWEAEQWAVVDEGEARGRSVGCLAVCGGRLLTGSAVPHGCGPAAAGWGGGPPNEVGVWDPAALERRHALRQPAGADVAALLGVGGEVWGIVGGDVVVWGVE